jgi:hypothetical protein
VNVIENSSGIFVGTNLQTGWSSYNKSNSGLGNVSGDFCRVSYNVNVVYDNDLIDMPVRKNNLFANPPVAKKF